jgi:hypothetical protein
MGNDVHRLDFVDIKSWQRPKTDTTKVMAKLVLFISKYRAHLSRVRIAPTYRDPENFLDVPELGSEFLSHVFLDFLDILDNFIDKLPDDEESGKRAWISATSTARHKVEVSPSARVSDFIDSLTSLAGPGGSVDVEGKTVTFRSPRFGDHSFNSYDRISLRGVFDDLLAQDMELIIEATKDDTAD